jgi:hypothetical protein
MATDITLQQDELQALTGYKQPAAQLNALLRQGYWRACRARTTGEVILERGHYEVVRDMPNRTDFSKIAPKESGFHGNSTRRAEAIAQRTPTWADQQDIAAVYERAARVAAETGIPHHVDHVIPLQGKLVSGLHVANNLQPIPARDNILKSNRFEPC